MKALHLELIVVILILDIDILHLENIQSALPQQLAPLVVIRRVLLLLGLLLGHEWPVLIIDEQVAFIALGVDAVAPVLRQPKGNLFQI